MPPTKIIQSFFTDILGDALPFLQDGMTVQVQLHQDRPIGIKLPDQVELIARILRSHPEPVAIAPIGPLVRDDLGIGLAMLSAAFWIALGPWLARLV